MPDDGPIFSHQPTIGAAQREGEPEDTRSVDMRESYPDGYDEEYGDGYDDGAPMVEVRGSPVAPPMVRPPPLMHPSDPCVTIGGRALSPTNSGMRLVRVQSILNNNALLNPTQIAALDTEMINGAQQFNPDPRLWEVRTFGEDSMNSAGAGAAFGTWGAIGFPEPRVAQNCAAARAYSGRSWLHARVRWDAPGTSGIFDMDLGGPPIELYANNVRVNIIAPANHVEIFEGVGAPAFAGPWTLQCLTDGHLAIVPIEGARGQNKTTLTTRQEAAANTQIGFEIPAYAKSVIVYQSAAGAASPAWTFETGAFGAAAASIEVGQLPFIAGQRRTDEVDIVPGATFIMSDVDVANPRLFTAVWEIEI